MLDVVYGSLTYKFEWSSISPPWYSGITQARVAKVFICAYIETKDRKYLKEAEQLIRPLFRSVNNGGFLYRENGVAVFEEYLYPGPAHRLNADLSVILDLFFINKSLQEKQITNFMSQAALSLPVVIPLFVFPSRMQIALDFKPGKRFFGKKQTKQDRADNVDINKYVSYDEIHLMYLHDLYTAFRKPFYRHYFYKFFLITILRDYYQIFCNVASDADIINSSGFSGSKGHSLSDAFNNYRLDPKIYAASRLAKKHFFVLRLKGEKSIRFIDIRFHWYKYPRDFTIKYYNNGHWHVLVQERNWQPKLIVSPRFKKEFFYPVTATKVRFESSNYTKNSESRLYLDYFNIENYSAKNARSFWKAISETNMFKNYIFSQQLETLKTINSPKRINNKMLNGLINFMRQDDPSVKFFNEYMETVSRLEKTPNVLRYKLPVSSYVLLYNRMKWVWYTWIKTNKFFVLRLRYMFF